MTFYHAFQLRIHSHFSLPGFKKLKNSQEADVEIVKTSVIPAIEPKITTAICFHINEEEILISLPKIARILLSRGEKVSVFVLDKTKQCAISLFLINQVLPLLTMQRGNPVLHAGLVEVNGKAIAIAGHSGSGKSVLCAQLDQKSYPVLADECCVLSMTPDKGIIAFGASDYLQLWENSFNKPELDQRKGTPVRKGLNKFFYHTVTPKPHSLPLHAVIILTRHSNSMTKIRRLTKKAALIELLQHSLHTAPLKGTELSKQAFTACSNIAQNIPVFELQQPSLLDDISPTAQNIESIFN